jgi:hypothetical protein
MRKTPRTKWRPSRINEITDSRAETATKDPDSAASEAMLEAATIATRMGNTASTAKYRTTLRKNAERE